MSDIQVSHMPPGGWEEQCSDEGLLFYSRAWQELLASAFQCRTRYAWDDSADYAMAVATFRAGPFRIGYLGFPIGGLIGKQSPDRAIVSQWRSHRSLFGCHCLRIPASAFNEPVDLKLPSRSNPESAICELQYWSLNNVSKKLRRDLKRAQRTGLQISDAPDSLPGSALYSLYKATVTRNRGSLRYNEKYFAGLLKLLRERDDIRCMIASSEHGMAGFAIFVHHAKTTYYLHGGSEPSQRHLSPSDLLLHEAILWGQSKGCDYFNFMTSSSDQPSLVRYKEKWGAITRPHKTYILALRPTLCASFRAAEWVHSALRNFSAA